jgi:hypothetical protein
MARGSIPASVNAVLQSQINQVYSLLAPGENKVAVAAQLGGTTEVTSETRGASVTKETGMENSLSSSGPRAVPEVGVTVSNQSSNTRSLEQTSTTPPAQPTRIAVGTEMSNINQVAIATIAKMSYCGTTTNGRQVQIQIGVSAARELVYRSTQQAVSAAKTDARMGASTVPKDILR